MFSGVLNRYGKYPFRMVRPNPFARAASDFGRWRSESWKIVLPTPIRIIFVPRISGVISRVWCFATYSNNSRVSYPAPLWAENVQYPSLRDRANSTNSSKSVN